MWKRLNYLTSIVVLLTVLGPIRGELIGHWTLDETSGTTAADASGRGHDGTYVNSPGLDILGVRGTGMDAAGGYMEVDLGADLPTQAEERTIALWVNTQVTIDRKFVSYGADVAGQGFTFCIENVNGEDGVRLRHWGGNMFYAGFVLGEWNHIAIRIQPGSTLVNDTEVLISGQNIPGYRSGGSDQTLNTAESLFRVGTSVAGQVGQVFEGLLDDVYFYDNALSDAEVLGVMEGQPWPYAFGPSPRDGAMIEATWANFSWQAGDFAASHNVYISSSFDDVKEGAEVAFVGNQATTSLVVGFPGFPIPEGLAPGTIYYWRIDEVNEADPNSPWKGNVWSLSVPPKTAYAPDPADGAGHVDPNAILTWTGGYGAKLHTVYIGDNYDDVDSATGGMPLGSPSYDPGTLEPEKVLYWRVDEFDGFETHKGDVWSFTTPGAVGNPQPANGAADVQMIETLSWAAADNATSHELYFGTDADAVKNATAASTEYVGPKALGAESYDPGGLDWDSSYAWRVDEVYPTGTVKGITWTFTTADFILVDDFESYDDIDPAPGEPGINRIFDKWIDGFGTLTNGALIGNDLPPYAETTIVHGGAQSMIYRYDNAGKTSEATLTLVYPRDWTEQSVTKLSVWFRGASANAADRIYVALNGTAVVYHDDPAATQSTGWKEWVIDLAAFGINLTNVNSITIGVGTQNAPAPTGSTGTLYFDDIRLIR